MRFKRANSEILIFNKIQILTIVILIKCYLDLLFRCFNAPVDQKAHKTSNGWKNKRIKRLLSESNLKESISYMY